VLGDPVQLTAYEIVVRGPNLSKDNIGRLVAAFAKNFAFCALVPVFYIAQHRTGECRFYAVRNISEYEEREITREELDQMREFCNGFNYAVKTTE
jgi:hypothetical protein